MGSARTPDFKGPRRSGDRFTPDTGSKAAGPRRGAYPKDAGGPPEHGRIGSGPQGDAFTPAKPANAQIDSVGPRKPTASNTTTNPLK